MTWQNCYDESWKGLIVDEAFAHPAKFASGLINRIADHLDLPNGSVVVDPFGGVGLGGIVFASRGVKWIGCELEEKFVRLGLLNFCMHTHLWTWAGDPEPELIQGDSRQLRANLSGVLADCVVSSPPYSGNEKSDYRVQDENGLDRDERRGMSQGKGGFRGSETYGQTPGQLGSMPAGSVDAVVSGQSTKTTASDIISDYGTARREHTTGESSGQDLDEAEAGDRVAVSDSELVSRKARSILRGESGGHSESNEAAGNTEPVEGKAGARSQRLQGRSGESRLSKGDHEGQVREMRDDLEPRDSSQERRSLRQPPGESGGALQQLSHERDETKMVEGQESRPASPQEQRAGGLEVDCVVSSPPYEGSLQNCRDEDAERVRCATNGGDERKIGKNSGSGSDGYSNAAGNLGNQQGDTFWEAAKLIVRECHAILKPNGLAVWVVKNFVRRGEIVPFSRDWATLCESEGFELVEWIQASLVKETRNRGLFEDEVSEKKERKSFFRRLAEKKGSPPIDHEDVLIMRPRRGEWRKGS